MNIKRILILALIISININLFGQPCGPIVRLIDRQTITSTGDLLLLYTWFDGGLMLFYNNEKTIPINYVLISDKGAIKKDTIIFLKWPERHYDFTQCKATYKQKNAPYEQSNKNYDCANYMLYTQNDTTILGYFLEDDKKYAYEIIIDNSGNSEWIIYNFDTIVSNCNNDSTKLLLYLNFLKEKHDKLTPLQQGQYEYKKEQKLLILKGSDVYLTELSSDTIEKETKLQYRPPNKWIIIGKEWEIPLDGYLIHQYNSPLITMTNQTLFVTVFNSDSVSCPSIGSDVYPIVYCIDIFKGRVKWKQSFR